MTLDLPTRLLYGEDIVIDIKPSLRMYVLSFNIIEAHIL